MTAVSRHQWRILFAFIALGLIARSLRYVLQFPLWEDEAFLFMNLVNRSYTDLLKPLELFHQVAPALFLWAEKAVIDTLGVSELTLRLFPYLCSVASLLLFFSLARRLLTGWSLVFAVAILAVSYPAVRYAAEMKQYGVDLFVSVMLLWMWERWSSGQRSWLWFMAAAAPLFMWLSFPSMFVAGGISLALFVTLVAEWKASDKDDRSIRPWIPWLVFNTGLLLSFALLYSVLQPHFDVQGGFMTAFWQDQHAFPPWRDPLALPKWLLETHAGKFLAFPVGGRNFGSTLSLILCILGAVRLWRSERRRALFLVLFAPAVLHLVAAGMHRYPYGGNFKFAMALAPAICLLAGSGAATVVNTLRKRKRLQRGVLGFWAGLFLLIVLGSMVRDVVRPYKTLSDERARGWAQWFWHDAPQRAVVVDMYSDLGLSFANPGLKELSWSATYLANQHMYSPRHRRGDPPEWSAVSADRPLWIVEYRDETFPYDNNGYARWLRNVAEKFHIGKRMVFPMSRYAKNERDLIKVDEIHLLPLSSRTGTVASKALLLPVPKAGPP